MRRLPAVGALLHGARSLRRRPTFALVVVASLALGVGASCVVLRMADRLLLHPLAVSDLGSLYEVSLRWEEGNEADALSYPAFRRYAESGVGGMAAFATTTTTFRSAGTTEVATGLLVSPGFFQLLGVEPQLGRGFRPGEEGEARIVLGWDLWNRAFGGDPAVVGRVVHLNGHPFTVVGVAPRSFHGLHLSEPVDFWVPVENLPRVASGFMAQIPVLELEGVRWLGAVVRLGREVQADVAAQSLTGVARSVETSGTRSVERLRVELSPLAVAALGRDAREELQGFLGLLALVVAVELLITGSNLAGMFFARGLEERRASAIRFALGASRSGFVRGMVLEAFALVVAGSLAGLGLAVLLLRWIASLDLPGLPALAAGNLGLPPAYVLAVVVASLAVATLLTVPVAWRLSGFRPMEALKQATPRLGSTRLDLRRVLVAAQISLALVLVSGAALFGRSLEKAWTVDPGFRTGDVVSARIHLGLHGYDEPRARNFYAALQERASAGSAFASLSISSGRPLGGGRIEMGLDLPGSPPGGEDRPQVPVLVVSPEFFRTLGIDVEQGRSFAWADREGAPAVALVSHRFAERLRPGGEPLGQKIGLPGSDPDHVEIVGVVSDLKLDEPGEDPQPILYLPLAQHFGLAGLRPVYVLARSAGAPSAASAALRQEVERLEPALRWSRVELVRDSIRKGFLPQQLATVVLGFLGFFALVMVAAGIYATLAGYVAQHRREIGIRMTLGAHRGDVLRLILFRLLVPVTGGLAIGGGAALVLLHLVESLLYAVEPVDLPSLLAAGVLVAAIAVCAAWLPARKAAGTSPARALRWE